MIYLMFIVAVALVGWAVFKLDLEKLRSKQIDPLKKAIKSNERKSKARAAQELENADVYTTIGFLNDLHKDDSGTD